MNVHLVAWKSCSCCHDFLARSQHQSFELQPIKLDGPPTNDMPLVDSMGWSKVRVIHNALVPLESMCNCCDLEDVYLD